MPLNDVGRVATAPRGLTNGSDSSLWLDPSGALVTMDFLTKALLDQRGFQVRIGSITTPVTGDVLITDTAAELCADSVAGLAIIPVHMTCDIEALGGTLPQVTVKLVGTASSAGTAFTPLPLMEGGRAASTTARASASGGVTVTAEAVTTTSVLFMKTVDGVDDYSMDVNLLGRGAVNGAGCVYLQVGSVTTGSSYFAHLNYLEFTTAHLGL